MNVLSHVAQCCCNPKATVYKILFFSRPKADTVSSVRVISQSQFLASNIKHLHLRANRRQPVSHRPVKSQVQGGTQADKGAICSGKRGSGTEVSHIRSVLLVAVIPQTLHTLMFIGPCIIAIVDQ